MLRRSLVATVAAVVVAVAACGDDGKDMRPPSSPLPPGTILDGAAAGTPAGTAVADGSSATRPTEPLQLLAAWPDSAVLPARHTCADVGASPALAWTAAPPGTTEMAVVVEGLTTGRVHWLVEGIDPAAGAVAEGELPLDAVVRMVDGSIVGWDPPCPAPGEVHELLFTVYALPQQIEIAPDAPADEVIAAYEATAIDRASITAAVQLGA